MFLNNPLLKYWLENFASLTNIENNKLFNDMDFRW